MAYRVNTKVVIPLIVVLLVLVGGVLGLAYFTINRGPDFYKRRGDVAAAAGDWRTAEEFYSKGVNRDQGNIEMIDLWRDSIAHIIPADAVEAGKYFQQSDDLIRRRKGIRSFEPQFHLDWLSRVLDLSMPGMSPGDAASLAREAETMLAAKPTSDDNPLWEQGYRYRGIGNTYRMQEVGLDQQIRDQALADLQRSLAANPDDSTAVDALTKWHLFDANALRNRSKSREALARVDEAVAIATDYLKTHPTDVLVYDALAKALSLRPLIARDVPGENTDTTPLARDAMEAAQRLALAQTDLPLWVFRRVASDLLLADDDPASGARRAAQVIEHALEGQPDDPVLRYDRAGYLAQAGQRAEAMAAFQQIIDAPNLPISLQSVQLLRARPLAVVELFDMDLEQWRGTDRAKTEEAAAARAKVQSRIDQYRGMVSSSDPKLAYMEGRLALSDRKPEVAANRLNQYLTMVGHDTLRQSNPGQLYRTLLDLASALQQSNRSGAAYEFLAEADALAGGRNIPIIRSLIMLDLDAQRLDRAEQCLNRLVAIDPDSDATRQLRNSLTLAKGGTSAGVEADATLSAVLQAREMEMNDQFDEARALLLKTQHSTPNDTRVLYALAKLEQSLGNTEQAVEYVSQALVIDPESDQWRILQAVLLKADLRPVLAQIVDERPGLSEFERHVAKWHLYAGNGFPDEAQSEFEAAKAIDPEAPTIIEQEFAMALAANDLTAAQNTVRRAQATNADLANGLTFRGRYELQSGDTAAAIATLLQATTLKPYDGSTWRFLGAAYREAGNNTAAMSAFSESLEKEPSNVITLKELARLQIQRKEFAEALKTIRKAQVYAPGDLAIQQAYLELEGQYGNRASVVQWRERLLAGKEGGIDNALALVELYELDKRFEDARKVLDSLSPEEQADQLRVAQSRSIWHARQNQIDEGREVLAAFTRSSPPPPSELLMRAMVSLMQYDINTGRTEEAIETARSAAPYQDPTRREADRALGQIYLSLDRLDEALETFERAFVSSKESPGLDLQLINLHLLAARRGAPTDAAASARHHDRAAALLDENEKAMGPSVDSVLLRGELAFQKGDAAGADRLFNDAVARYPQEARVYAARAKFNLTQLIATSDIGRTNRIRADVDQAMQLNPGNAEPLVTLVDLAKARRDPQTGQFDPDVDAMVSTWRRILKVNPNDERVRGDLVATLYAKREYTAAQVLIQEAINLDPSRGAWHEIRGDLERQTGAPPQSYVGYYLKAVETQPSANRVEKLARALLAFDPPRAAEVVQIYREFEKYVSGLTSLRLLLAQAQAALNDSSAAVGSLREAAAMVLAEPDSSTRDRLIQDWHDALGKIIPPGQFASLSEECFKSLDDPWRQGLLGHAIYAASSKSGAADAAALKQAGIEQMAAARVRIMAMPSSEERTRQLQQEIGWNLATAYYATGDAVKAVEAWRWVLEVAPNHFAALNNLAYALASDLNDPVAALEPAKRAYETNPADPTMLDTYGYVLFRNNRLDEAERMLRDSLNRAEQSGSRMHLGQVLAALDKVEDGRRELNQARRLAEQEGNAKRVKEVDELLKNL